MSHTESQRYAPEWNPSVTYAAGDIVSVELRPTLFERIVNAVRVRILRKGDYTVVLTIRFYALAASTTAALFSPRAPGTPPGFGPPALWRMFTAAFTSRSCSWPHWPHR